MSNQVILAGPGGNYTAFVSGKVQDHIALDRQLRQDNPKIEQTCFIAKNENGWHGEMAGGEFCGAAALSFGYLISIWGKHKTAEFTFSGVPRPLSINCVGNVVSGVLFSEIQCDIRELNDGFLCVALPGITHLVDRQPEKQPDMMLFVRELIARHHLQENPAVGLMRLHQYGQDITVDPWVWVRNIDSLINETACISGATAVGLIEYERRGQTDFTIQIGQPCGTPTELNYKQTADGLIDVLVRTKIDILNS